MTVEQVRDLELQLLGAVEPVAGSTEETAGAIRDFLPLIGKLLEKAKELIAANPEQADLVIVLVLRVYDAVVVKVPTGLGPILDQLLKAQIRQGLEAMLRQLLAG